MHYVELPDSAPELIKTLRWERGLTRQELAARAGLSDRAVRDIEGARRLRIQESTLLAIARALEVPPEVLLNGEAPGSGEAAGAETPPAPERSRRPGPKTLSIAALLLLVLLGGAVWILSPVAIVVDGPTISGRAWWGIKWTHSHGSSVRVWTARPWAGRDVVVYALGSEGADGGEVFVRARATGRLLGRHDPDPDRLRAAFGKELVDAGAFAGTKLAFGDLDGDGSDELVVAFAHQIWYPGYVEAYRADGSLLGAYHSFGLVYALHVEDLDGDGKDEVLVSGTNNAKAYQGASVTLLDDTHFSGATVDSLAPPRSPGIRDGSLARVVLPQFDPEFQDLLDFPRLRAGPISVTRTDTGEVRLAVPIGEDDCDLVVTLGPDLAPIDVSGTDSIEHCTKEWPEEIRQRFLGDGYLREWLSRAYLYGARWEAAPRE